ncbi:cobalt ECF transporter T component CbiQ [uncultured Cohaesibacter sp.]|uniref:cobalt ECF transporter T component CbiQ n=1 Tax=uncultured Cohaesibacter sp. TaxID=1002546 RepID=UPI0029C67F24|nr:cobalt ECF transporter T component CbiQ [uncultured Cohaesibacter sp.]
MSDLLEEAGRARALTSDVEQSETVLFSRRMWIRELDPRVRIVTVLVFSVCVVQLDQLPLLAASLCASLFLLLQAQLPFLPTIRRVMTVDSFIILLLVMLPFTTSGTELFSLFGWPASYEGLLQAVVILLRANAIVMATLPLIATIDAVTFGHALASLRVPERLVHLLLFTVRYIEVLHTEYKRLRTAMKCRAFAPSNSLHTYKSVGYLVGMLLIRSFERSERILMAMKCRGFNGQFHLLKEFSLTRKDCAFALLSFLFILSLMALEVMHVGAA